MGMLPPSSQTSSMGILSTTSFATMEMIEYVLDLFEGRPSSKDAAGHKKIAEIAAEENEDLAIEKH